MTALNHAVNRATIQALREKLHRGDALSHDERQQLSGILCAIDLQLDLLDEIGQADDINQAMSWRSVRNSVARKFPKSDA